MDTVTRMTFEEIDRAYAGRWVVLDEIESNPATQEVTSARVRASFDRRSEAWEWDSAHRDSRRGTHGVLKMGPRDPNLILVL